jgi:hypothetical protein
MGKKRTVLGSTPARGPDRLDTPISLRINPPRAAKCTPSPTEILRGCALIPATLRNERMDPSPTPQPRKTAPNPQLTLTTESRPRSVVRPMDPPQIIRPALQSEDRTNMVILQAILAQLEALKHREVNTSRLSTSRTAPVANNTTAPSAVASGSGWTAPAAEATDDNPYIHKSGLKGRQCPIESRTH